MLYTSGWLASMFFWCLGNGLYFPCIWTFTLFWVLAGLFVSKPTLLRSLGKISARSIIPAAVCIALFLMFGALIIDFLKFVFVSSRQNQLSVSQNMFTTYGPVQTPLSLFKMFVLGQGWINDIDGA